MKITNIKLLIKTSSLQKLKLKALMCPTPLISNNILRIYFSGWGLDNISLPYRADFLLTPKRFVPKKIEQVSIVKNSLKSFYKKGIILTSVIKKKNIIHCAFAGYSNSVKNKYKISTGLAEVNNFDEKLFIKFNKPFIKNGLNVIIGSPFLFRKNQKALIFTAEAKNFDKKKPNCKIYVRFLTSLSTIPNKNIKKFLCFNYNSNESMHARPFVFKKNNYFKMLFSVRNTKSVYSNYFGTAISKDCIKWKRTENIIFKQFKSVCYLSIFSYKKKKFALFNTEKYGKEGIFIGRFISK